MKNAMARCVLVFLLFFSVPVQAGEPLPFFDVHVHYKWDQAENTTPQQALEILTQAGVAKAVVIGRPADLALQLYKLAPQRIIPFFGPYQLGGDKFGWQFRRELIEEAREGLRSGLYRGIGELHLIGGMAAHWQRSGVFTGLLELAREYRVPIMLHSEYSSVKPTLSICQGNPDNRLLLAHAGAVLDTAQIEEILQACPNVMMDLAARDAWRYVNNPITGADGRLLPEWEALLIKYAGRFMLGSDPVWPVDKGASWDEADSGWERLPEYIAFHRHWLAGLPAGVAEAIRWGNADCWLGGDNQACAEVDGILID